MYSISEIKKMQTQAKNLKLNVDTAFVKWSRGKLQKVCNGVGAEAWPHDLREKMNIIYADYQTAYADHDVRYTTHSVSKRTADKIMLRNSLLLWKNKWGFWRFFRPLARAERVLLLAAYAAVKIGGEKAWSAGIKSKEKHKCGNK